ncbi:DUF226 domain-containing protein [Borrelia parkeri]|uniref:DUF226 domain-containing protein n=1 Tax=Borrelia parkeri TaxID=141 RepID=UPI0032B1D5E4
MNGFLFIWQLIKIKRTNFLFHLEDYLIREKITPFNLFSLKDDDKFLGIYYGYRKPIKNIVRRV